MEAVLVLQRDRKAAAAMTWVRIDDEFFAHPKVLAAGPLAVGLHVIALSWSAHYLTDGRIPLAAAYTLCDFSCLRDLSYSEDSKDDAYRTIKETIGVLLTVGLWEEDPDSTGYIIHDYLTYNPSRDQILANREAAKGRMAKLRSSSELPTNIGRSSDEVQPPRTRTHNKNKSAASPSKNGGQKPVTDEEQQFSVPFVRKEDFE